MALKANECRATGVRRRAEMEGQAREGRGRRRAEERSRPLEEAAVMLTDNLKEEHVGSGEWVVYLFWW